MDDQLKIRSDAIEEYYDIGEQIGSGQFAVVKKLHSKSTGDTFAAKFMKKKRSKALKRGMTREQFLREADVLRSIDHKGVIYLHDIFETKLEFVLVLELLCGGELFEFLSEQEFLTEDEAVGFLKQVIEAIDYLHKKRIVHLDIKPENIVLKEEKSSQIKLIDFGLARKLSEGEMVREIMGTPEFVAPEIIAFEDVGTETDMWAIGVLTYIMLSGASPFLGDDVNETFSNISMVDYEFDDEYFKDISDPSKDFISSLLVKDKRERMNAEECLKHEWMQDFEDQELAINSEDDFECEVISSESPRKMSSVLKKRRSTLIKTDAFKAFTARARWQKSLNKVIAISRLALLGKKNGPIQHRNASDETKNPLANNETNEKHTKDSESNKIEDIAQIEGKLMKMEAQSATDEKKILTDINTKDHVVKTLVENNKNRDFSSKVESLKISREGNETSLSEDENYLLQDGAKTNIVLEKNSKPKSPSVISRSASNESYECSPDGLELKRPEVPSERVSITSEKYSNKFDSIRSMFSCENHGIYSNVSSGITEGRVSSESWRHPQLSASAKTSHMSLERSVQMLTYSRRSSEDKPKDYTKYDVPRATAEDIDNKNSEDSVWLKSRRPFSLEKNRKKPIDIAKGFTSTKNEVLKWERRNSSEARSLTSRGDTKRKDDQRLSLPRISKTKLNNPLDGRQFERHTITNVQKHEREEKAITTKRISPEKEAIDLPINKVEMNIQHGKVEDDASIMVDREIVTSNTTTRSTLTLKQGLTVHNIENEGPLKAIIDREHAFVIQANFQDQESDDSNTESPYLSHDEEADSPMGHNDQSGQKATPASVNYKLGSNEMEGFPELSLTLQKSPISPGDKEDKFVWLITKEKNQRRDFLSRVLAPKVQAAKKSQFQDVFQKRRIRHKPMGEKGPPKSRSVSVSSPADSISTAKIYVKHHSVPSGPTSTQDGKHVATVQLSSDMSPVNLKIQMGEFKQAEP